MQLDLFDEDCEQPWHLNDFLQLLGDKLCDYCWLLAVPRLYLLAANLNLVRIAISGESLH